MFTYQVFKNFRSPCFELSGTLILQLFLLILYESTSSISYLALLIFITPPRIPPAIAAGGGLPLKRKVLTTHLDYLLIQLQLNLKQQSHFCTFPEASFKIFIIFWFSKDLISLAFLIEIVLFYRYSYLSDELFLMTLTNYPLNDCPSSTPYITIF